MKGTRGALGRRRLAAALAWSLLVPAALAQTPPPFLRVLWLDGPPWTPAQLAAVKAAGYHAVNLGVGADPAPIAAAGLGVYVDQPAGKGLLELRDAEWDALRAGYERDRNPAQLHRPICLQDGDAVAAAAGRAAAMVRGLPAGLARFVALADEASATRHANPLDLCTCERCLRAFREFLRQRYASVDALNLAWQTTFADFDAVQPLSTDQIRRRELGDAVLPGNLRPWNERLEFVDRQLAAAVKALADAVHSVSPLPVGLTGIQPPSAFGGHDFARLLPGLTVAEPYDIGGAAALADSFLPADCLRLITLFPPTAGRPVPAMTAQLAAAALHGRSAAVVWNGTAALLPDGTPTEYGRELTSAFARLQPALDACAGAQVVAKDVWVVESQASVRAWWMLDSAGDGATWVRRLSSYEAAHSTSLAARSSWIHLLQDLGLQPRFVAAGDLPERLLQQRPRCLVLPACLALPERSCQAIETFVLNGGSLLADHSTALYDEQLVRRQAGGLDATFGLRSRSLRWEDQQVSGGKVKERGRLRSGLGLAETSLRPLEVRDGDRRPVVAEPAGDERVFIEHAHGRGRTVYLNLAVCEYDAARLAPAQVELARELRARVRAVLQAAGVEPPFEVHGTGLPTCLERARLQCRDGSVVYGVRLAALDRPEVMQQVARNGPVPVSIVFPTERHLRQLGGDDLGRSSKFDLRLDVQAGLFLVEVGR